MRKEYVKPSAELISFSINEVIADELMEGEDGMALFALTQSDLEGGTYDEWD